MRILFSLVAVLLTAGAASAQPANQNFSVQMCAVPGTADAQGNPLYTFCGTTVAPFQVQVQGQVPTHNVTQCPPNPLTRKVPPLC